MLTCRSDADVCPYAELEAGHIQHTFFDASHDHVQTDAGEERRRRFHRCLADVAVHNPAVVDAGCLCLSLGLAKLRSHMPPRYDKEIGQKVGS